MSTKIFFEPKVPPKYPYSYVTINGCESGLRFIMIVYKAKLFKMFIRITWSVCPKCKLLGPAPDLWKKNDLKVLLSVNTVKFLLYTAVLKKM